MYASGRITPAGLIDKILDAAERDGDANIWITPPVRGFIQEYLDRLADMDIDDHPLWGIPFAIKDNIDLAGVPTTSACPAFRYIPRESATIVNRLIAAGAIPIGKTNMDQFATGLVGVRSPYGEVHNAFRPELISGGSSAGSAVAVAKGQCAFALGTDTAGSGRIPAALNGLVGYKASVGAWPTRGSVAACASIDCITVFAHSLDDVYLVDSLSRGIDSRDPWSKESRSPVSMLPKHLLVPERKLRFFGDFAAAYEAAWERSLQRLHSLGIAVDEIDIAFIENAARLLYEGPFVAERWAELGDFVSAHPSEILSVTREILESPLERRYDAAAVFKTQHLMQEYRRVAKIALADAVLMLPTCGGTWSRDQVRKEPILTNSELGLYTNHCNLLDLSAVSLPAGFADAGLPFGVSLFALSSDEDLMRGAAERFMNAATVELAVCGLHMRGFELEDKMWESGARFVREDRTAKEYRLYRLSTNPRKPALAPSADGQSIAVEIWDMPVSAVGKFLDEIPSPLGLGKVRLQNGEFVTGFIYDQNPSIERDDITEFGSWAEALSPRGI
jgi:allophanate hydrolase